MNDEEKMKRIKKKGLNYKRKIGRRIKIKEKLK